MRFDAVIELVALTYAQDALGQQVATKSSRQVYANEYAVTSTEYYTAGLSGLKPERSYQVRSCDYEGESLLHVDGVEYDIVRAERRGEWTRLVCQRRAGNVAQS